MANAKKAAESKFRKEELLIAVKFANRRDLLEAILEADKEYTISDVEKKINDFYGKAVN